MYILYVYIRDMCLINKTRHIFSGNKFFRVQLVTHLNSPHGLSINCCLFKYLPNTERNIIILLKYRFFLY